MPRIATIFLVAVLLTFVPTFSFSGQAGIKNTLITNNKKELLVYFYVDGCFTPKIEEAIQSGIPTTFIYKVYLYSRYGDGLGPRIASKEVTHTIKFDPLKKEYTVSMSEKKEPVVLQDFSAAKKLMAKVDSLTLIPLERLQKDAPYSLQIKAEMDTVNLPPPLNYLFFFASFWDFETEWETVEFTY